MRKEKWIIFTAVLSGTFFCLFQAKLETAYAAQGWKMNSGDWMYLDSSEQPVSNAWEESGNDWYYLGDDGRMAADTLIDTGNGLFYVDENGKRVERRWVEIKEQQSDRYEDGWYYFGANGRAYNGTTSRKKQIDGKTYVFDDNGKMETGWLDESGNPLDENDSPILEGVYYAGEDGALWKNQWLDYSSMDERMTTDLDSGIDGRDYNEYSTIWMYFDKNSKRIKGSGDGLRQKTINGDSYGFDANGVMVPWWSRVASDSNAQQDTPAAKEPVKFYSAYNGGKLLKDTWFWMYPSENMDDEDYADGEYSWWHTDGSGNVYKNKIKKIVGKKYAFDELGRMQTGFVYFQNRNRFVAQYDLDMLTADLFKDGSIPGTEGSDLYLFSPDELNDGSMQTGKNIKVELDDGEYTFGFASNGIAYGNRNQLQKVDDSFYINGLRLEADENYGYGVVRKDDDYYVVNTQGKRVSGDRKIVKDRDGGWILMINGKFMARVTDADKPKWYKGEGGPGFYHYDSSQKGSDRYGELITQSGQEPDISGLASEEILYVESGIYFAGEGE